MGKYTEEHSDGFPSAYPSDGKVHQMSYSTIRSSINFTHQNTIPEELFHVGSRRHLDSDCSSSHCNERDSSCESEANFGDEESCNKQNLLSPRQTNMYSLFMINDTMKHQAASSMLSISESYTQKDNDSFFHQKVIIYTCVR